MSEITLTKHPDGSLRPVDQDGIDYIAKLKVGVAIRCSVARIRNYQFHKKYFQLLNVTFDNWSPAEVSWHGQAAEKNFDEFRSQVTILAGYRDVYVDVYGKARVRAKSISFASMDQDEFDKLYPATFAVCWKILMQQSPLWTQEELQRVVSSMQSFI